MEFFFTSLWYTFYLKTTNSDRPSQVETLNQSEVSNQEFFSVEMFDVFELEALPVEKQRTIFFEILKLPTIEVLKSTYGARMN